MICAIGKNREIGFRNKLLWNLPEDMKHFVQVTSNHTVIMGEKTFQSIGKPLPNRKNIVVSLSKDFQAPGCEISNDLFAVLNKYKNVEEEVFVIGGGMIYKLSLPMADKLYLTLVDDAPEADTFFPDYSEFRNILKKEEINNGKYKFKFIELIK
ncbi:MAG: Dihydrofolate reductase [Candidatus Moranbacteria bacterium GW2011_GWF2_35_39]|nr:MAG: Dihydrofolate reductase [Candidatus Moranbacteria bacterium GW2011_GWF2_35_39]